MSSTFGAISAGFTSITTQNTALQPRGLYNFILEIRNAPTKEEERSRVDKELANIRQKFATSSNLNSYQKKKYVWKMCYIYMLGYEVDFGHLEFISLLSSSKFQEKAVGYMAVALLLKPGDEMITLVINSIRNDIVGTNHAGQTLALAAVANIGGTEFGEALTSDVVKLVHPPNKERPSYLAAAGIEFSQYLSMEVLTVKKSILCLLRLFRNSPDNVSLEDWSEKMVTILQTEDLGVITSALSLLTSFASTDPSAFQNCVPHVINILYRLAVEKSVPEGYRYYKIPSPWIQVKCLKFLQYYHIPTDKRHRENLFESINKILVKSDSTEGNNKLNAENSVLFEAVNLIISLGADLDPYLRTQALSLLGRYIGMKDANIRFLGLCSMATLVRLNGPDDVLEHLVTVVDACKDADHSVAKKALDLLFVMTQESNITQVVAELLVMLTTSHESLKEELVVKIAIISEKYTTDMPWYVDTLVQTVLSAGDFVSEDVWFRVVQVVTNHPEVQEYASNKLLQAVQSKWAHATTVTLAGYILGEFGVSISEQSGCSGYEQFSALHQHFLKVNAKVQAILLTSYAKLMNLYPDTKPAIEEVLEKCSTSPVLEIQQRACEYLMLTRISPEVMETVLNSMPMYSEEKASLLLNRLGKAEKESSDRAWHVTAKADEEEEPARPPSQSLSSPVASARHKVVDLLSLDEDAAADDNVFSPNPTRSTSGAATTRLTDTEVAEAKKRHVAFGRVTAGQRGVIFENAVLSVSASAEYRAHQGRIAIFIHNKTHSSIDKLMIELPSSDAIELKKQDPASSIGPNEEAKVLLAVDCIKPFLSTPEITISFTTSIGQFVYELPLPFTLASFVEPIVVEKADYMARWKSLEGEDREAQQVFAAAPGLTVTAELMQSVRASLFPALHLGLATGLDSETTATACGTLRTGTLGQDGATLVSVGAMARLEADVNSNRYRLTVRAKHPTVAQALLALIKSHLG